MPAKSYLPLGGEAGPLECSVVVGNYFDWFSVFGR